MIVAKVRLFGALPSYDKEYTYAVPHGMEVECGCIAAVPFGGADRGRHAVVVSVANEDSDEKLKYIIYLLPKPYMVTKELMTVCKYLSSNIFCSFGDISKLMLPAGLKTQTKEYFVKGERYSEYISEGGKDLFEDDTFIGSETEKYLKRNVISKRTEATCHINDKKIRTVSIGTSSADKLKKTANAEKYKRILEYLSGQNVPIPMHDICALYSTTSANISYLEKGGFIKIGEEYEWRTPSYNIKSTSDGNIALSSEQKEAFESLYRLYRQGTKAALLYGVTGSGKTQVMLKLIDEAVIDNKGVIFLVPEIALTSQSARLLLERYPDKVALLHSGMSQGERHDSWYNIATGKKKIVLGTRSAVFAPVHDLALVIIDEEQDDSYKSDITPKYHAKDVARCRCANENALLLLASATPDIESFYKASIGKYELIRLKARYGNAVLPETSIVDIKEDLRQNPNCLIGEQLLEKLHATLNRGEQAVLLVNRRGYQNFLSCRSCGFVVTCPNCSVSMTYHTSMGGKLVCHYCGYTSKPPEVCPSCNSQHLSYKGFGTEKLEEELNRLLPQARVIRMDADTTSKKNSHDEIIEKIKNGDGDILIGTQMIAKGHNFPKVTLVGVILADLSLYISDYRAGEKTFSLLTQAVGRAGRGELPGYALIQTLTPYHEVLELCPSQNYEKFYEGEIKFRKSFLYPPFCNICLIVLSAENEEILEDNTLKLERFIEKSKAELKMQGLFYGPFECIPYKLKNVWRKKIIVKYKNNKAAREFFSKIATEFAAKLEKNVHISIDTSPSNI